MARRTLSIMVTLVLAMALAAPAAAGGQRPIHGQFTAQAGPATPRCGDDLTLGFEIEGVASHLGTLTGSGSNCTEWSLSTAAVAIWDGLAAFTAADGSTLSTVSEGTQDEPVSGVAAFLVTHVITGGTGRFDGASGVWIISGQIDFTSGTITGQANGWLSY